MTERQYKVSVSVIAGCFAAATAAYGQSVSITSLTPNSTTAGSPGFTLRVNGTGFSANCGTVYWNNTQLSTTLTSSALVQANVPANLVANPGTAQVQLRAASGSQTCSNTLPFTINLAELQITSNSPLPNGNVGTTYPSFQFQATGGYGNYSWSAVGAPNNLTVSASGVLSGVPTVGGTTDITVRVVDCPLSTSCIGSQQLVATKLFSITIQQPGPQVSNTTLPNATLCASYNNGPTVTGGTSPYVWSATGVPPGLTIDTASGRLTGTPTQTGSYQVAFTVRDSAQRTNSLTLPLQVLASTLQITTATLPTGTVGLLYSGTVNAAGGTQPYTFAFTNGQPPGLSISSVSSVGSITGTPTNPATFPTVLRVTDGASCTITKSLPITINPGALTITTTALDSGRVGTPYSFQVQLIGGTSPFSWSATGLPQGLAINSATGLINGTPAAAGMFNVTVRVGDAREGSTSRTYTLQITSGLNITTQTISPARVGQPYSQFLQATGGSGALTWSLTGATAPGLSIDAANGILNGTPTVSGDFGVNVQVRDSLGAIATRSYLLNILPGLQFVTESIPSPTVGSSFTFTFVVTGGVAPFRFQPLSGLPPGLTLDQFGTLSGTPTQIGVFPITVQVTDSAGISLSKDYPVVVGAGFRIVTEALVNGAVGATYNLTLSATGGRTPLTWSLATGTLPQGLTLSSSGAITGTPTQAGTFTITVAVVDGDNNRLTKQFTFTIRGQFSISTETLPSGTTGTAYSQTLATAGGTAPVQWSVVTGNLPAGLVLGAANGVLSGTPTAAGSVTFTVEARESGGQTARQSYTLVIVAAVRVTTTTLPGGRVNTEYSATLAATGGEPPYTWAISAGTLPAGLSLDPATGDISGTPTTAGTSNFTVRVTDSGNRTATQALSIVVAAAPVNFTITTATLPGGTAGIAYTQTLAATGGSGTLAWTVGAGALPDGLNLSGGGVISGTPTRSGAFNFTAAVRDAQNNTASRQLSIQVASMNLGTVSIAITGQQQGPGDQPGIGLQLATAAQTNLTGTLTLSFQSDAGGVTDPALKFSQTTPTFTVASGQQQAVFPGGLNVQLGTVAGLVTITARLTAGGVDVTPSPAPTQTIRVNRMAPVIKTMNLSRSGSTLTIDIIGFSTTRDMTSADIQFTTRAGSTVQTSSFTVQLGTAFSGWYKSDATDQSRQFGSNFTLTMPFTVSGDISQITGATVSLTNSVGRSSTATGNF